MHRISIFVLLYMLHFSLSFCQEPVSELPCPFALHQKISEHGPETVAVTTLESCPSSVVAGCVNAISGDYFETAVDLVVPGPQPLVVQRTYCSSTKFWQFLHFPQLEAVASKKHTYVTYHDDRGAEMVYSDEFGTSIFLNKTVKERGLTNCGLGEVSGQTNWKNSKISRYHSKDQKSKKEQYQFSLGGIRRLFTPYRHYEIAGKFPLGKFRLDQEIHPNGNYFAYEYKTEKDKEPVAIRAFDKKSQALGVITVSNERAKQTWECGNQFVQYFYNKYEDREIIVSKPSNGIRIEYEYDSHRHLEKKKLPDGRYLQIEYGKRSGELPGYSSDKTCVKSLRAPVGTDNRAIVTHSFLYKREGNLQTTQVRDAKQNLTEYTYDKWHQRLESITRYLNKNPYITEKLYWGDAKDLRDCCNLLRRTYETEGESVFCRQLTYDSWGNITQDALWGNLTGCNANCLNLDSDGQPIENGCDVYVKTFENTQDSFNLPLKEIDGSKTVEGAYYKDTNLLKERFTTTEQGIVKREFFEYDDSGVPIIEIWDDGKEKDRKSLSGVTERHIRYTTPSKTAPIGLPEIVEEKYLDFNTNSERLLKKIVNKHSPEGYLQQQEHYGSDGLLAYTLNWEHNKLGKVTSETNALGDVTTYTYDDNGNKKTQTLPNGTEKEFTYDFSNRLIKEEESWTNGNRFVTLHAYNTLSQLVETIDIFGNKTTYSYDGLGRVTEICYPPVVDDQGKLQIPRKSTKYDALHYPIEVTDANGNVTKYLNTIRGKPYKITYPDGSIETKEYTLDGKLKKEVSKNGLTTIYDYDDLGRLKKTTKCKKSGEILSTKTATYNAFHLESETDESGLVTTYKYDFAGRKIKMINGHQTTTYSYDLLGRVDVEEKAGRRIVRKYDFLDRVLEERIEDAKGVALKKEQYEYDTDGNRIVTIAFTQAGEVKTTTEYNPHKEPILVIDSAGNETHIAYEFFQNEKGQTVLSVTKTDPLKNQEISLFDTHDRLRQFTKKNFQGDVRLAERYNYDLLGNKRYTIIDVRGGDPSIKTVINEFKYDNMNHLVQTIEAKETPEQKTTTYHYNLYGQNDRIDKPDGVSLNYEYDAFGRLETLKSSDNTISYSYTYDVHDHPKVVNNELTGMKTERAYDAYGRIYSETLETGYVMKYGYDQLNRVERITLPDESSIQYQYDAYNLKTITRFKHNLEQYVHTYESYDLAGNILTSVLPGKTGSISYGYDKLQRVISLQAPKWQEDVPAEGYDAAGNLLKRQVVDSQGPCSYTYTYDDLYQLTSENTTLTYQYDSLGNRMSKNGNQQEINSLNQLLHETGSEYTYDLNGNLKQVSSNSGKIYYRYDGLDRLIEVFDDNGSIAKYSYDPFHRRLSKTTKEGVTDYLYQGTNEIGSLVDGDITELRVLGTGKGAEIGAAVAIELHDEVYVPIHDPYGNVVTLLDLSGSVVENYRFTAFGEEQIFGTSANPWRYSSKRFDPETGFIYFGRRYYSSDIGRWMTPDPAGYADGPNLYAYVHNHPLAYVDPDGQLAFFIVVPIAMIIVEPFLPAITAGLAQYTYGAAVAGCISGFVQGYNDPTRVATSFGALMMGDVTAAGPLAASLVGAAVACSNPTKVAGVGARTVMNVGAHHLSSMATTIANKEISVVAKAAVSSTQKTVAKGSSLWQKSIRPPLANSQLQAHSLDSLSKAGQVMDRAGLTRAGRALEKHGNRPGSIFPKPLGKAADKNILGQFHLDDILTDPKAMIVPNEIKGFDYIKQNGSGARFYENGLFRGFLEP